MSDTDLLSTEAKPASVAFSPLPKGSASVIDSAVDLSAFAMADRVFQEMRQPLRELARRVRRLGPTDGGAMVLMSGSGAGTGCSTVTLALAAAASAEMPVLVIDADMKTTGLSRLLGQPLEFGWEDAVEGRCSFQKPLKYFDPQHNVAFLPLRQPLANPGELLAKTALRVWLPQVRQEYSLILVDGGSALETGKLWARWADVALLTCDARHASNRSAAWDGLEESGTHVLGIVERNDE